MAKHKDTRLSFSRSNTKRKNAESLRTEAKKWRRVKETEIERAKQNQREREREEKKNEVEIVVRKTLMRKRIGEEVRMMTTSE